MTDKVQQWRNLRNELDDMLKARGKKYAEVVQDYYKENPKDASEKKFSSKRFSAKKSDEGFSYENCVEKKYWKKRRLLQFVWRGWEESKQRFSPFPRVATPCSSRISA